MNNLNASIAGLNLDGNDLRVTPEHLDSIANLMRQENLPSFTVSHFVHILKSLLQAPADCKVDSSLFGGDESFCNQTMSFKFQSPLRPTARTSTSMDTTSANTTRAYDVDSDDDDPDLSKPFSPPTSSNVNSTRNDTYQPHTNTNFTGFFSTARSSIPTTFDTPPRNQPNEAQDTPTTNAPTPSQNDNKGANKNTVEQETAKPETGKAWFWGAETENTVNLESLLEKAAKLNLKTEDESKPSTQEFHLPTQPVFSLGTGSAMKQKRGRLHAHNRPETTDSLPNINEPSPKFAPPSASKVPIFPFPVSGSTAKASDEGTNNFSMGNTDILHGGNNNYDFKIHQNLFSPQETNDDRMSIDPSPASKQPDLSFQQSSNPSAPEISTTTFDFNIGVENVNMRSTKKRVNSAHKRTNQKSTPTPDLSTDTQDFPDLQFQQSFSKLFQSPTPSMPDASYTRSTDTKSELHNNVPSFSFASVLPGNSPRPFGKVDLTGDVPPDWWSASRPSTANTAAEFPVPDSSLPHSESFKFPPGKVFSSTAAPATAPSTSRSPPNTSDSDDAREEQSANTTETNLLNLAELYSKQGKELYGIGLYERYVILFGHVFVVWLTELLRLQILGSLF
jgi:hypothetical protein